MASPKPRKQPSGGYNKLHCSHANLCHKLSSLRLSCSSRGVNVLLQKVQERPVNLSVTYNHHAIMWEAVHML